MCNSTPWHRRTSTLKPGKSLLQIGLLNVGQSERWNETFDSNRQQEEATFCQEGPSLFSRFHHSHSSMTLAHSHLGHRGEKGIIERGYADVNGCGIQLFSIVMSPSLLLRMLLYHFIFYIFEFLAVHLHNLSAYRRKEIRHNLCSIPSQYIPSYARNF